MDPIYGLIRDLNNLLFWSLSGFQMAVQKWDKIQSNFEWRLNSDVCRYLTKMTDKPLTFWNGIQIVWMLSDLVSEYQTLQILDTKLSGIRMCLLFGDGILPHSLSRKVLFIFFCFQNVLLLGPSDCPIDNCKITYRTEEDLVIFFNSSNILC